VLAALVIDDGGPVHRWIGYAAAAAVGVRWTAGLACRRPGSLRSMMPSWAATAQYLRALRAGPPPRTAGHDALGLWMVWLLWLLVIALGVTGWMSRLDAFWGDDTLDAVHSWLADILLGAVLVHVAAVVVMSLVWRENLPLAMVTGRKRPFDSTH